jgi:diphthamide biosynthesis enzyme Dph1/Dph2-like protein
MFQLADGTELGEYAMFYIGPPSRTLVNLMIHYSQNSFFTFDPETSQARKETLDVSAALRRRWVCRHGCWCCCWCCCCH